ncbi:protein NYNRIN-like, partial [Jatropha curcas]|uniref:protein NYNRIN-like n=1 Tax=Jatropha curcas TaxID=180498 RepID=UPI0018962075
MEGDCVNYVRHCKACQYHDNKSHLPAIELHPTAPSWPFSAWGIDIIGKITPAALNGHQYILVAVDYFSRWIEAQSYKTLTAKHVARFIEQNIFCRYGVPHHIVTDNGSHSMGSHFSNAEWFGQFAIVDIR